MSFAIRVLISVYFATIPNLSYDHDAVPTIYVYGDTS